jgi:hypothetical protein
MTFRFINTSKHNKGEDINNDLKYVPFKGGGTRAFILTWTCYYNIKDLFFEIVMLLEKGQFCSQIYKRQKN